VPVSHQVSPKWVLIRSVFQLRTLSKHGKLVIESPPVFIRIEGGNDGRGTENTIDKLLQISGAGNTLNVSRSSVYRLIERGELDVVYVLGSPRITQESVDSYITKNIVARAVAK
jgi:excisionase family DNA binding protein